jgi:hypothetical protein
MTGNARTTRYALKREQIVLIRRRLFIQLIEKVVSIQLI